MKQLVLAALLSFPMLALSDVHNTHIDQLDSLSYSGVPLIEVPHAKYSDQMTPSEYLIFYSGAVVSIGRKDIVPKATIAVELMPTEPSTLTAKIVMSSEEDKTDYTHGMKIFIKKATCGGAAPITPDGYFLTAWHVTKYDNVWISYRTSDEDLTTKTVRCRIVYENRKADITILKADLATERFLQIRSSPLKTGDSVFAGSWFHMRAAGKYIGLRRHKKEAHQILTSIPLLEGDSGSPLIDERGYLCGITSAAYIGKKNKREPQSTFSMLDTELIFKEIEKDRNANKSAHTTPAIAPR
ncbi:serine protease [Pelagicoccus sp. SDUM812003]|uniref:S1 family peptidase n=1 Tax=Pelagicoccus sp. SDUM812003 TaxID=3041267 RepID=UPI00280EB741|nr:serine protease [Pelagicoccus sp. SDUM812003]MDQ8205726.1 serine protease [Pelagicoccus sp. SDUM812003]